MSAAARPPATAGDSANGFTRWLVLLAGLAAAAAVLWGQPAQQPLLALLLLVTAGAVAWRPVWVWTVIAATLPLDLAPLTGRTLPDEYDAVLALGLALAWWRSPARPAPGQRALACLLGTVLLLYGLGALRPLWPWQALGPDAAANPLAPLNGLRIARGALWAGLAWAVMRRHQAAGWQPCQAWGRGMVWGLLATVACVVAERLAFSGLFDVSDGYRVAGPFSAMQTGGAYIEAYLVTALPFLAVRLWPPVTPLRLLLGVPALLASVYAVMVTFSRGGYAALLLGLLAMAVLGWRQQAQQRAGRWLALGLAAAALAVVAPIVTGEYARSRLATVDRDLQTRENHWSQVLQLAEDAGGSALLGMGVGRLPALALLHGPPGLRSGSFRVVDDGGQRFLRLGSGGALDVDQLVTPGPGQALRVTLRLRSASRDATLQVNLCEKWLIASATCQGVSVPATTEGGDWRNVTLPLDRGEVGDGHPLRPLKLGLSMTGSGAVDVAEVQLVDATGEPLLRNGRFNDGLDHWGFTADNHLAWHAKSLPLGLLFDLGGPGLLAMASLLGLALVRAGRAAWAGQRQAAALAVALLGFAVVGSIDTLLDAPRFLMLWLLLCAMAAATAPADAPAVPATQR